MAASGIGSMPHLASEQLTDASGANLLHVPYKGAAPAITDVMGGQGFQPAAANAPSTPAELAALLERDTKKWGQLIRDKKIKAG